LIHTPFAPVPFSFPKAYLFYFLIPLQQRERERGMDRKVVAVCAVVGFLGLLSAALAFAAEATRVKVCAPQLVYVLLQLVDHPISIL
jgi:cobalamin synthase